MRRFALSLPKRLFGCALAMAAIGTSGFLVWRIARDSAPPNAEDVCAAAFLLACLALVAVCGLMFIAFRLELENDAIVTHGIFRTRRWNVSELAGFGMLILVVNFVPFTYVRLYDDRLRNIARIPIASRHRAEIEAWFSTRLPRVVDAGSPARPRPRFAAEPAQPRSRREAPGQ